MSAAVVIVDDRPARWQRRFAAVLAAEGIAVRTLAASLRSTAVEAPVIVDLAADDDGSVVGPEYWSLRLGEGPRSPAPFAREVARGDATFSLSVLRRRDGVTEEMRSGSFGARWFYDTVIVQAAAEAARWVAGALLREGRGSAVHGIPAAKRTPKRAAHLASARVNLARARWLARAVYDYALEITEWNIGLVEGGKPVLLGAEPLRVRWLEGPPRFTFRADPFLVERDGVTALLYESFAYDEGKGVIEAAIVHEDGTLGERRRIIEQPTHLSYPYPLEIGGELYVVPESSDANELALWRCTAFPFGWERARTMIPEFDAVDATIFPHGGRWWLFCTRRSRNSMLALFAFFGPSPDGPWTEHAANPIVVDPRRARPAGTPFTIDGALYRPGQNCAASYGGSLVLARVDELTPESYRETVVRELSPRTFGRYRQGIHTVAVCGERVVIDGKRVYAHPGKIGWALRRLPSRVGRLLARIALQRASATST